MSGGISLTAIASYSAIAAAAVTAGTEIASATSGAPKADAGAANQEISQAQSTASNARSALLETAGQSAGSPLQPGQVGKSDTVFGN